MKNVKVLGSGCKKCQDTAVRIRKVADSIAREIVLEKVTDAQAIMNYGVMSTPAVVVDGTLVHQGGMPSEGDVRKWLGE